LKLEALIVAAGLGKRMGGDLPKQFLLLHGIPVLSHTLSVFLRMEEFSVIHVGLSPGENDRVRSQILPHLPPDDRIRLYEGGRRRQDTVRRGLDRLSDPRGWVVIHDGVRPLVTPDLIRSVVRAAQEDVGAVCAVPASDTLKRVDHTGVIKETLSRAGIWQAQTPQVFRADLLTDAHRKAEKSGVDATDDAALLEQCGHKIRVVPGDPENVKITTPRDLIFADFYLSTQRE
jgi:2-C-methyl-D-erythritol 4-phosphate cytidylyltransferase